MDRLAACHAMYGFLQLPHSNRGRHPSAPNCQHVKRSLSLTDRRGIISPGRGSARGLISPAAHRTRGSIDDDWDGMDGKVHGPHSMTRLHDLGLLMHALGPGPMLLPATAMGFGRTRTPNRTFSFRARRTEQAFWSSGEQLGQLLLSLRYTPADGQLWIGVLRASGVRAAAPYVTVWLLREKEKPEKRSTPKPSGDSRRFSIAPVFDEAFFFEISPSELSTSNVVMNCGINGESNTEIGYCVLGELGIDEAGKEHWREAIGQPGRIITQWHGLMAE